MRNARFSPLIDGALKAPIDFSEIFTAKASAVARQIESVLGFPPHHAMQMDYRAGQILTVYFDSNGLPIRDERGSKTAVKVAISSRGPLFALLAYQRSDIAWSPTPIAEILRSPAVENAVDSIRSALHGSELTEISENELDELVPGFVTELDGSPATLRDVLFCELC